MNNSTVLPLHFYLSNTIRLPSLQALADQYSNSKQVRVRIKQLSLIRTDSSTLSFDETARAYEITLMLYKIFYSFKRKELNKPKLALVPKEDY